VEKYSDIRGSLKVKNRGLYSTFMESRASVVKETRTENCVEEDNMYIDFIELEFTRIFLKFMIESLFCALGWNAVGLWFTVWVLISERCFIRYNISWSYRVN
jgi:hypothetical protein